MVGRVWFSHSVPRQLPPSFLETFGGFFPAMFDSLPIGSHCHHDWLQPLVFFEHRHGLLVFSPQPGGDGFLYVFHGLIFTLAL